MDFLRNHSYHQHNSNSKAVRKLVLTPQHVQGKLASLILYYIKINVERPSITKLGHSVHLSIKIDASKK